MIVQVNNYIKGCKVGIKIILEDNPVIAAVKDEEQLKKALDSNVQIIFVLWGDLLNITKISEEIYSHNKVGMLHIDLVEGLSNKEVVLKYLKEQTKFQGIISTKPQMVKYAKSMGLYAVQRVFLYDTISLNNAKKHIMNECDAIEMLPGIMPKVIKTISGYYPSKPIICGGLIESKDEVIQALSSGATCVSTTKEKIWDM